MSYSLYLYAKRATKILSKNNKISTFDVQNIKLKCSTEKSNHRDTLFKLNKILLS